jgi:hypothetical protein
MHVSATLGSSALAAAQRLRTECGPGEGMDARVEATQERLPEVRSKSPAPAHGLAGQESGKRQAGWPSLLVTYLLATQEISNSAAASRRKLLLCLEALLQT